MSKIEKYINKRLLVCIISMILILLKMNYFNNIFLIMAIIIMSISIIVDTRENKPIYLFFMLPLIYVMKFSNGQISMYNVLVMIYLMSMIYIYIKESIRIKPFIFLGLLIIITLVNSLTNEQFDIASYIGWILNIIVLYFIIEETKDIEIYRRYSYYFALSMAIVGICGIIFMNHTNIGTYLYNMRRTNTVLTGGKLNYRYCGFDLDPNYFALQSLIAFWSVMVTNKVKSKYDYVLLAALIIVGLSTISKMYIITLVITSIIYFLLNIKNIKRMSIKKTVMTVAIILLIMTISKEYILPVFETRIEKIETVEDLTTGRSEIWKKYIEYISNNIKVVLIGEGIGVPYLNNQASHNTYILLIYRLGIIGTGIFILLVCSIIKTNKKIKICSIYSIPFLVFIITNCALDIFDFDCFIYMLILVLGIYRITEPKKEVEDENKKSI